MIDKWDDAKLRREISVIQKLDFKTQLDWDWLDELEEEAKRRWLVSEHGPEDES